MKIKAAPQLFNACGGKYLRLFTALLFWAALLLNVSLNAQIVNIEELRIRGTNDTSRWYGNIKMAVNFNKVQESSLLMRSEARVQYKHKRHLALGLWNTDLVRAGNEDFKNYAFAHLRYNFEIHDGFTWEAYAQIQTNKLLYIQSRTLSGTGPRLRLFKSKNGKNRIYLGASAMYERNDFIEANPTESFVRLSSYLSFTFRPKHVELSATTYFQPAATYLNNYRFATEWQFAVPFNKHLALIIEFDYAVDRGLPALAPVEVYAVRNGISWVF
ncbi:MAG: DUF481 domain-containing protein [Saprospiraceae bacterium]|nr:DUF481 domain-containing protein [Saprospiraceae bacterium]MCC6413189.1 DUF481 domain-containing protein [Saprospiraceae bacterium]